MEGNSPALSSLQGDLRIHLGAPAFVEHHSVRGRSDMAGVVLVCGFYLLLDEITDVSVLISVV